MKQILIDTDILLQHLTTKDDVSILMKLMTKYDCFTTVINAIEVYEFVGSKDKKLANMVLYGLKILGIHSRYSEMVADLIENQKIKRRKWNLRDALFVMMSLQNKLFITTLNPEKYLNYNDVKFLKINKQG